MYYYYYYYIPEYMHKHSFTKRNTHTHSITTSPAVNAFKDPLTDSGINSIQVQIRGTV